jgi:hypothetical protein
MKGRRMKSSRSPDIARPLSHVPTLDAVRAAVPTLFGALCTAHDRDGADWVVENLRHEPRILNVEKIHTGYAAIALVIPESRTRTITRKLVISATHT